ncbi:MAG TPA: LCP family protein [Kineosporiaceae bacterium]
MPGPSAGTVRYGHPASSPRRRGRSGYPAPGRPVRRRRRWPRVLVALAVTGTVVASGAALLEYQQLNRNIRSVPLFAGVSGDAGTERVDPFGHSPINVLVIGSDARNTAADCALGHDCRTGVQNADVELLVHVAADRSNASVLSIPRDTITTLPSCRNPTTGRVTPGRVAQINASLVDGPGCTVAAVHQLTGVPIDHFAMVDFAGVVAMSDAAGGVPVCVTADVFDPYSHLRLTGGRHVLKGVGALQFVRSRHAFGDGSDLGRTYAQHLFLGSMIRTLKGRGVVTNPATLVALAQAATKALTVDSGLASIRQLVGLAGDLDQVPPRRITFATMPTSPDPNDANRVIPGPTAPALFRAIAADTPLTRPASRTAASPSAAAGMADAGTADAGTAGDPAGVAVRVLNGTGVAGRATGVARALVAHGFSAATSTGTAAPVGRTSLRYPAGSLDQARAVAAALKLPPVALVPGRSAGLVLTIGADWTAGTTFPASAATGSGASGGAGSAAGAGVAAVPSAAHASTADQATTCAPVSTARTVALKGVPMTPTQAFRRSAGVALSAP